MTVGSRKVFEKLKELYPQPITAQELVKQMNDPEVKIQTVTGSVNGLSKKGYATRTEQKVEAEDGKVNTIKLIALTDAGFAYDPDAAVEKTAE